MDKELLEGILALARKRPLTEREVVAFREALRESAALMTGKTVKQIERGK